MNPESRKTEYPYIVKIETASGESQVPVAFLTAEQVENLLQSDFKRLVQEAGVTGVRLHVERAPTADYEKILQDVAACLRAKAMQAA